MYSPTEMIKILLRGTVTEFGYRAKIVFMEISKIVSVYLRHRSSLNFHRWLTHDPERITRGNETTLKI